MLLLLEVLDFKKFRLQKKFQKREKKDKKTTQYISVYLLKIQMTFQNSKLTQKIQISVNLYSN